MTNRTVPPGEQPGRPRGAARPSALERGDARPAHTSSSTRCQRASNSTDRGRERRGRGRCSRAARTATLHLSDRRPHQRPRPRRRPPQPRSTAASRTALHALEELLAIALVALAILFPCGLCALGLWVGVQRAAPAGPRARDRHHHRLRRGRARGRARRSRCNTAAEAAATQRGLDSCSAPARGSRERPVGGGAHRTPIGSRPTTRGSPAGLTAARRRLRAVCHRPLTPSSSIPWPRRRTTAGSGIGPIDSAPHAQVAVLETIVFHRRDRERLRGPVRSSPRSRRRRCSPCPTPIAQETNALLGPRAPGADCGRQPDRPRRRADAVPAVLVGPPGDAGRARPRCARRSAFPLLELEDRSSC